MKELHVVTGGYKAEVAILYGLGGRMNIPVCGPVPQRVTARWCGTPLNSKGN